VSFSEDCVRFGDRLRDLVEAGVAVKDAAAALGMSGHRCYAILRATGHPMGALRPGRGRVDRGRIVVVFTATGSIKAAAMASGISASAARWVLVAEGLVDEARRQRDKVAAKRRFLELVGSGWSANQRVVSALSLTRIFCWSALPVRVYSADDSDSESVQLQSRHCWRLRHPRYLSCQAAASVRCAQAVCSL
jgi:hypothetical protein